MNKYSSLKTNFLKEFTKDEFYLTCDSLCSPTPKGSISIFTMNQNQSLTHTKSSGLLPIRHEFLFPELPKTAMPSNRNFSDLLNKLDLISSSKHSSIGDQILSESDPIDCVIDEGSYFHLKIPTKNKPSPIRLLIKKSQGKVFTYSSFSIQKPSTSNYDQLFTIDSFEIRSLELLFKNEFLYLGLQAVVYTKLTISCQFGKKNSFALDKRLKKKEVINQEVNFKVRAVRKMKKSPETRDFIQENFKRRMLSPDELVKKSQEWLAKREKAVMKKKQNLLEKREKALGFINRQRIRREQALLEREEHEKYMIKMNQIKDWLVFLYMIKATQKMHEMRRFKRAERTKELTQKTKVRQIQRFFRQSTVNFNIDRIVLTRSQLLLTFYHSSTKVWEKKQVKKCIFEVIKRCENVCRPRNVFAKFIKKIENIQMSFRKYLGVKLERMRKLIIFWDECKSFQTRRSVKRKTLMYDLNITIYQRTMTLNKYYLDCLKAYYESIRVPQVFISQIQPMRRPLKVKRMPFHYMPTLSHMKKLIESAVQIPERAPSKKDSPLLQI